MIPSDKERVANVIDQLQGLSAKKAEFVLVNAIKVVQFALVQESGSDLVDRHERADPLNHGPSTVMDLFGVMQRSRPATGDTPSKGSSCSSE